MGKTLESLDYVQATPEAKEATKQFFNTKMFDYFKTKASSVSDPVREALINGRIKIPKDTPLEEQFPQALLSAARAGDVTAMRDIENRFDTMMGVKSYRVKQAGEGYEGSTVAQEGFNQTILQQMKAETGASSGPFAVGNTPPAGRRIKLIGAGVLMPGVSDSPASNLRFNSPPTTPGILPTPRALANGAICRAVPAANAGSATALISSNLGFNTLNPISSGRVPSNPCITA